MKTGFSTSVIQRGKTGIAQPIFALLRAVLELETEHRFVLFVLEEDLPLFDFVKERMELVSVSENFRPAVRNVLWHQSTLPKLARAKDLDVLHVPSYRRLLWPRPCPLVATIHDLAPFRVQQKYDWARMFYGRVVVKYLARRQDEIIAVSENTAHDVRAFFRISPQCLTVVEGFGMPPLEAMACGCPVVSSTRGSLEEVIGDAAWTVNPEDIGDMAEALIALASNPQRRVELRNLGIARAKCFTWQKAATQMLQVYNRAVGQKTCMAPQLAPI
jgi:glycosyltransferase involved in cell wall biosynthesis